MIDLEKIVGKDLASRMGEFFVPPRWLGEEVVRKALSRMVILEAKLEWNPIGIKYLALSPDFESRAEDQRAPKYVASYVEEVVLEGEHGGEERARSRLTGIKFERWCERDIPPCPAKTSTITVDCRTGTPRERCRCEHEAHLIPEQYSTCPTCRHAISLNDYTPECGGVLS